MLNFLDMPQFVAEELELRGLNLPVEIIRGKNAATLEKCVIRPIEFIVHV